MKVLVKGKVRFEREAPKEVIELSSPWVVMEVSGGKLTVLDGEAYEVTEEEGKLKVIRELKKGDKVEVK